MDGNKKELLKFILATIEVREEMITSEGKNPYDYSMDYTLNKIEAKLIRLEKN